MESKNCLYCGEPLIRKDPREYVWKLKKFCNRRCKESYKKLNYPLQIEKTKIRTFAYYHIKNKLGSACSVCGSKDNLEVHHKNYEDMTDVSSCVLVCRNCHLDIHGRKKVQEPKSLGVPNAPARKHTISR